MKKIFVLMVWAVLGGFFLPAAKADEPMKIGSVDMQKALNFSIAGQEAKKMITAEVEKMEKSFVGKQKELEKLKEDLEKRSMVMSENVRKEKERDYQTKLRDLQRMQRDYEEELRRKDRELTEKILKELAEIVRRLGTERKYTMIIEKNQPAFVYVSNILDLTEEVIKIMNEKKK